MINRANRTPFGIEYPSLHKKSAKSTEGTLANKRAVVKKTRRLVETIALYLPAMKILSTSHIENETKRG